MVLPSQVYSSSALSTSSGGVFPAAALAFSLSLDDRRGFGERPCSINGDGICGGGCSSKTAWKRAERSRYSSSSGPSGGAGITGGGGAKGGVGGKPVSHPCGIAFWFPVPPPSSCSQIQNLAYRACLSLKSCMCFCWRCVGPYAGFNVSFAFV